MIHIHVWHPTAKLRHSLPALSISITSFQLYASVSSAQHNSTQAEPTAFEESTRSPFTLAQSTEPGFPFETVRLYDDRAARCKMEMAQESITSAVPSERLRSQNTPARQTVHASSHPLLSTISRTLRCEGGHYTTS